MSALESIRKRAKLLVIIIGASLMIFVLEDALNSGKSFFGGGDNIIAVVNGKKIDYSKFVPVAEAAVAKEQASLGTESLKDSDENVIKENAFRDMISHMILDPQYEKLGISVPDSELSNLMIGSNPAPEVYRLFSDGRGHIAKQFQDPRTGGLNMAMVIQYVKQMNAQELARWEMIEDQVKNQDLQSKYFYLLVKGLFIPDAIAKLDNEDATKTYNISYVLKRYTDIPDNSITVSEQDIQDYYNKHMYEYNQQQESRKVDYITFNVNPSDSDMMSIKQAVDTMYNRLKHGTPAEDSANIVASDAQVYDYHYHKASELPATIDTLTHTEVGTVYGPYQEDGKYKIAKLLDIAELPDSIRYSQIFIPAPNGDLEKVKPFADSIKSIAKVDNFAELAKADSKDRESAEKGGDMGWITSSELGSPELMHQLFFGNVGTVVEVPIQSGFIIICVTDQTKRNKYYKVGIAEKNIEPSQATQQKVFAIANDFEAKNRTSEAFEKAAAQMNSRTVDLGENDNTVEGLESPSELVKWAYDKRKEGDVSDVITAGDNKYIIAHLIQITKMGTIPLEQVKNQVKEKVIADKKAEKIMADMKSALAGGMASVAQKVGSAIDTAQGLTFESYTIPSLGKENVVIGTMSALSTGAISQPVQGQLGVYIIKVDSTYYTGKSDYRITQMKELEEMRNSVPNEAYNALIKKAGYVSHYGRYF